MGRQAGYTWLVRKVGAAVSSVAGSILLWWLDGMVGLGCADGARLTSGS
jgi:hypothetical protein